MNSFRIVQSEDFRVDERVQFYTDSAMSCIRIDYGGLAHVAAVVDEDLEKTGLSKPERRGLADTADSTVRSRSVHTSELATVLPIDVRSNLERYRYISLFIEK